MDTKNCLIRQPAGWGDIIFCQKIAAKLIEQGYHVHWPVVDFYYDTVNKYMKKDGITFCRETDEFPFKDAYNAGIMPPSRDHEENLYIPLQYADKLMKSEIPFDVLSIKYKIINLDYFDWTDYVAFDRDLERENRLFYEHFGLKDDSKYVIVNRWFGTTVDGYRKDMNIPEDMQVIEMEPLGFDNIFDWCKLFENATEIHTVDTAICYIMEKLNLKADSMHWYTRNLPQYGYAYCENIYKNNWNYNL